MGNDINVWSCNIGTIMGTARALFKVPDDYGGITLLEGHVLMGGTALSSLYLCSMDSTGVNKATDLTAIIGGSSDGYVQDLPKAMVFTVPHVAENTWIGIREATTGAATGGTTSAVTIVELSYLTGGHA